MSLDPSFNPFALHPFTSGGSLPTPNAPSHPISATNQAQLTPQSYMAMHTPQARRSSPTTPPQGQPPRPSAVPQQTSHAFHVEASQVTQQARKQDTGIFTQYKADGRRTPDLGDIINKKASRWPVGGKQ